MKVYAELIMEHLFLVVCSCTAVILIGIPLGIFAYYKKKAGKIMLSIIDIVQTVPVLAIMGLLMILFGANSVTVIASMVLYLLLPIVGNTYQGLVNADPILNEAAMAMGMNRFQRLKYVQLPQAVPFILTGIRICVTTAIGIAVFGTFVGGGGLGSILYKGIRIQDLPTILYGTLCLIVMSVLLDSIIGVIEKKAYGRYSR